MSEASIPQEAASEFRLRLCNALASAVVVVMALAFYALAPRNRMFADREYRGFGLSFSGADFVLAAAVAYMLALSLYFFTDARPGPSKSLRFLRVLVQLLTRPRAFRWSALPPEDRLAVRATLVKALFGPLMGMALFTAAMGTLGHGMALISLPAQAWENFRWVYDRHLHRFLFQAIVMVDVFFFTCGYLIELPRLNNQIRSVDPTFLGCAVTLLCYTPFNMVLVMILGSSRTQYPSFDADWLHFTANATLLLLMAGYASASVALGFKASNLTHRGIVSRGPYAVVRHPAYTCKNIAWWLGSIPIVHAAFTTSTYAGMMALGSVIGWTFLYVLRALTEEDHLRSVDGEYAAYASQVRWRFIPGLI